LNGKVLGRLLKHKPAHAMRRWLFAVTLLLIVVGVSGCHTLGFYGQAVKGQYQIFAHQEPIENLAAAPSTPALLKQRFELLSDLRGFAQTDLKLPTDSHYRKYVDVHRPFVVWNVEAASEFSMEPKTWWYPFLGSLEYRGYFSKKGATNYADYLRGKGYDVSVGGVGAYSTLGWFKDPVLNTFIFEDDSELAEIIFHELAHQRLFARGDTDFNEAFATTVGQEGSRRWLKARKNESGLTEYLAHLHHSDEFVHLIMATRTRLQGLYHDRVMPDGKIKAARAKPVMSVEELRQQKQAIIDGMLADLTRLKKQWSNYSDYDGWLKHPINNAHLNSVAAYYDLVPAFEQLLALNGGNMEQFYRAAEQLAHKPKSQRQEQLRALAKTRMDAVRAEAPPNTSPGDHG
jgi:predicted aminopeptidase